MSGKDILKQNFDKDTGRSFQVYNELFDEDGDVYLRPLPGTSCRASMPRTSNIAKCRDGEWPRCGSA